METFFTGGGSTVNLKNSIMWHRNKTRKLLKVLKTYGSKLKECRVLITNHHIEIKMHHSDGTEENWVHQDLSMGTLRSFTYSVQTSLINRYGRVEEKTF